MLRSIVLSVVAALVIVAGAQNIVAREGGRAREAPKENECSGVVEKDDGGFYRLLVRGRL